MTSISVLDLVMIDQEKNFSAALYRYEVYTIGDDIRRSSQ